MKSFLNYFALKITLLKILLNVAIYSSKYSVSHITVIPKNDTFLHYFLLHNFMKSFSSTKVDQIENKCLNDYLSCLFNLLFLAP